MKRLVFLIIAIAACTAQAQVIYRCGQTYSQKACPDGKIIDSSDPRTAAQRAEAKRVTVREKQLAAKMERERRAQELAGAASQASNLGPAAAPMAGQAPVSFKHKPKKANTHKAKAASGADFTAVVPTVSRPAQK